MSLAPVTIYFDEAGNTGAHLLDPAQPVFTLASLNHSTDECQALLETVWSPQAQEAKFTALRKSATGRTKLLNFIKSPLLTPERVKLAVTNKPFMVITKIVDIMIEPLAYDADINLYENGMNLSMSHVLFYGTPAFCGKEIYNETLSLFVSMIRDPSEESKNKFFASVSKLYQNCRYQELRDILSLLEMAEPHAEELLENIDSSALDPAIPAFFYLCSDWGRQLRAPFDIVHDSSKPISKSQDLLESMMSDAVEPSLIGVDRRKFEFPLRATGIHFGDSRSELGLQVADLLAGTMNYYASRVADDTQDDFCADLAAAEIERFTVMNIWPTPKVTPESLGTIASTGEIDASDAMIDVMDELRQKRR